ncbi:endochitinase-like [Gastrolobium bilobum]|uniref:endochitinase-like n=1 Tax=Gastrolobium bilobum TaxID=150636 RepID=UPI002AB0EA54|nr:endochitinase-like [Gastrolobium bilobum]
MKLGIVFAFILAFIVLETSADDDVIYVISASQFEELLKHRNDGACEGKGFYTYDAFLTAARSFGGFGTTGDLNTRKKELAAFLAQTSHETTGGGNGSPDGPYAWGYCFITERNKANSYCDPGAPCAPGKSYYGRGPIQLTHNYNYNQAGKALNLDLIKNPDIVAKDAVTSFRTAIWFWMTPQGNKPSCHDVITNRWTPSAADRAARRFPGYGVITNIINGGIECGHGPTDALVNRIGFYKRYCDIFGLTYGPDISCRNQRPFGA